MIEWVLGAGHTILWFLVALSVLIFFHELGHFWVARRCGVRVDAFSIGFGRELLGWTDRLGTRWKICALPLGGYVKMFGDSDASSRADGEKVESMTQEERAVSFHHKSLGQRAAIVAAGPVANFLLAGVLLAALFIGLGRPYLEPVVGKVLPATAAAEAGFEPRDRIVAIDGAEVRSFSDVVSAVSANRGEQLSVEVDRRGQRQTISVTPRLQVSPSGGAPRRLLGIQPHVEPIVGGVTPRGAADAAGLRIDDRIVSIDGAPVESFDDIILATSGRPGESIGLRVERGAEELDLTVVPEPAKAQDGETVGRLGLQRKAAYQPLGPLAATAAAVEEVYLRAALMLTAVGEMIVGDRSAKDLSGPIGIAVMSGDMAENGVSWFISFLAALSISLGILNLLPIPILDGGHLLFYAFEWLRGKPLSERAQEYGFRVGLALVLMLMVFATWNDIRNAMISSF